MWWETFCCQRTDGITVCWGKPSFLSAERQWITLIHINTIDKGIMHFQFCEEHLSPGVHLTGVLNKTLLQNEALFLTLYLCKVMYPHPIKNCSRDNNRPLQAPPQGIQRLYHLICNNKINLLLRFQCHNRGIKKGEGKGAYAHPKTFLAPLVSFFPPWVLSFCSVWIFFLFLLVSHTYLGIVCLKNVKTLFLLK